MVVADGGFDGDSVDDAEGAGADGDGDLEAIAACPCPLVTRKRRVNAPVLSKGAKQTQIQDTTQ